MSTVEHPMPDFFALLPQAEAAGVAQLPPDGAVPLAAAAQALGFLCAEADLAAVGDKPGLLAALAEALALPAWFGENWDALEDCLTDMSWSNAEGYVLILRHADRLHELAEGDFLTALRILADVSTTWAGEGVAFWTFVEVSADNFPLIPSLS